MFKFFTAILATVIFGFCFYSLYAEKTPLFRAYADEYEVYFTAGSFGNGTAVVTEKEFGGLTGLKGESCAVKATYEMVLNDFSAVHLFSESTESGVSYYAYSPKIRYKTYVKGRAVNIQYHAGKSGVKLGSPVIYGSF